MPAFAQDPSTTKATRFNRPLDKTLTHALIGCLCIRLKNQVKTIIHRRWWKWGESYKPSESRDQQTVAEKESYLRNHRRAQRSAFCFFIISISLCSFTVLTWFVKRNSKALGFPSSERRWRQNFLEKKFSGAGRNWIDWFDCSERCRENFLRCDSQKKFQQPKA